MSEWLTPTARPIAEAITGRENLGDLSRPEQAVGGIARGWKAIRAIYERLFAGDARLSVEFHDYTIHGSASMFYAVGRERGRFERGPVHHGSIEDPALLGAYRDAVGRPR